jgi:hypothetical protein
VAWLSASQARPHSAALRIDAVAVLLDARGALISLDQLEDVA